MDDVFPVCGPDMSPRFVLEGLMNNTATRLSGPMLKAPGRRTEKARGGRSGLLRRATKTGTADG